jgi:hypothetical protein
MQNALEIAGFTRATVESTDFVLEEAKQCCLILNKVFICIPCQFNSQPPKGTAGRAHDSIWSQNLLTANAALMRWEECDCAAERYAQDRQWQHTPFEWIGWDVRLP